MMSINYISKAVTVQKAVAHGRCSKVFGPVFHFLFEIVWLHCILGSFSMFKFMKNYIT